jgi:hypothetical protein
MFAVALFVILYAMVRFAGRKRVDVE